MWRRVWLNERKGKRRTSYALRWYGDDGRIKTKAGSSDHRVAEQMRREYELKLNSGEYCDQELITFEDFTKEHQELILNQVVPATHEDYGQCFERFGAFCGKKWLEKITVADCERFFAHRLANVKPATANKDVRTLHAAFRRAVKRSYLRSNPWDGVSVVREPEKELRVLTQDEVAKLLSACHNLKWSTFIFLAVTTGLRRGELCHLEWDDLDLEAGILKVRNKVDHRTKSGRNRVVALVPVAVELLRKLRRTEFGSWVFQGPDGGKLGNNVLRTFHGIIKRAGITWCTIHDLRRTFVSHLAMAGVNEAVVQKLAGHASMSTTLKHYTLILPEVAKLAPLRLPWAGSEPIIPSSYQVGVTGQVVKTA